jgi:hypothetical protein
MEPAGPAGDTLLANDLHVEATYRLTEALVQAGHQMRRRVELLSEVVFETDAAGRLVFLNGAWLQTTGHAPAACLGRHLSEFVVPEDWPLCERTITAPASTELPARPLIRMHQPDGTVKWAEMSIAPIAHGGAVGAIRDVTQQKLAQDELAKVSLVANHTDNMVIITDRDGRTEWVNQAFLRKTGYIPAELVGRKPGNVLQGPGTDRATVARIGEALREGRSFAGELLNYTRQGEPYWVQINITPVRDQKGDVERFVSVQTDSTELRRTQQELEAAKRRAESANEAKTRFLATISHEMRTPLNAILGSTDLALDDVADPAGLQTHLRRINDNGQVLMRLISDLLDLSKIEAGQIVVERIPVSIEACLESSLAPIVDRARAKGLDFSFVLDRSLPPFMLGDPDRLRQIVTNLAENAVKFTDTGYVRVEANHVASTDGKGPTLEIRVVDSGVGIPDEAQARIFDRFVQGDSSTTRRKGGAGLGLSIVRSLAEALGGAVSVYSRQGGGADFRVVLPLIPASDPSHGATGQTQIPVSRPATAEASAPRILVAEDNDSGFAVLQAYLTRAGYAVERAIDGRQAVEAAPRCHLILMDLEMPEMDGLEATQRIRARERERNCHPIPILALTAHALQEYRDLCVSAGCSGYLSKPVRMRALLEAVEAALGDAGDTAPRAMTIDAA